MVSTKYCCDMHDDEKTSGLSVGRLDEAVTSAKPTFAVDSDNTTCGILHIGKGQRILSRLRIYFILNQFHAVWSSERKDRGC